MLTELLDLPGYGKGPFTFRPEVPTDRVVMREIFVENVYDMHDSRLGDGWVVDVGANIGAFSHLCARYGAQRILAIEPDPDNMEVCQVNLEPFPATVSPVALWRRPTTVLEVNGGTEGNRQLVSGWGRIEGAPLHQHCAGMDVIDVLKIDTEGGEYQLTEDDLPVLRRVRYLAMEFHVTYRENLGALLTLLAQAFNVRFFGSHLTGGMLFGTRW